jgi:hypothetical protein
VLLSAQFQVMEEARFTDLLPTNLEPLGTTLITLHSVGLSSLLIIIKTKNKLDGDGIVGAMVINGPATANYDM